MRETFPGATMRGYSTSVPSRSRAHAGLRTPRRSDGISSGSGLSGTPIRRKLRLSNGTFEQPRLLPDVLERAQRPVHLVLRQRGADLHADPRGALGHDRIAEPGDKHAGLQQLVADRNGERRLADDDRHDRALALERLVADLLEPLAKIPRFFPQAAHELRMVI